jgi:trans-2,3-dihydro-3-hydroxyanthranilate isomerase
VSGLAVHWLDVFTDLPFAGNPLAVLPDADGLTDAQMQDVARELGLSETVFVLGGAERLRIFTPASELPLAGHPVVGTTLELARLGRISDAGPHVFQTGVGATPVEVAGDVATMTQAPLLVLEAVDAATVAAWLRLDESDIVGVPRVCTTTDSPQLFAQVRDRETLAGIAPDIAAVGAFTDVVGIGAWCEAGDELAQRFFAPVIGIQEDPATGSAAGALGALRVHDGGEPGSVTIRQGAEIGRPSEIRVTVGGAPGRPDPPQVGGRAVLVLEAELRIELS